MHMTSPLTGRILDSLSVQVTYAQFNTDHHAWNSKEETPTFNRLYFINSGEGSIIVNGKTYYPAANQLVIMPAGITQARQNSESNPYARHICHFDAQTGTWPLFYAATKPYIATIKEPKKVLYLFNELIYHYEHESTFSALHSQASLLHLIAYCLENSETSQFISDILQSTEQNKLTQVLSYIDTHLNEPLDVEQLASIAHLHPNYFIPYFKKHMDTTPMLYVKQKRLDETKKLLSYTDRSISDISNEIGMDIAHFSKQFKQYTGLSPTEYRRCTR